MAYTQDEIETKFIIIIEDLEKGDSLRKSLKQNTISSRTFFEWLDSDDEKQKQYARATKLRAASIFEDILIIADNQEADVYEDEDGKEFTNHNVIQRARLRVDSRKWMLSKLEPKKYGDKLETDNKHKGDITITRRVVK